jgi:hypothetical protein
VSPKRLCIYSVLSMCDVRPLPSPLAVSKAPTSGHPRRSPAAWAAGAGGGGAKGPVAPGRAAHSLRPKGVRLCSDFFSALHLASEAWRWLSQWRSVRGGIWDLGAKLWTLAVSHHRLRRPPVTSAYDCLYQLRQWCSYSVFSGALVITQPVALESAAFSFSWHPDAAGWQVRRGKLLDLGMIPKRYFAHRRGPRGY